MTTRHGNAAATEQPMNPDDDTTTLDAASEADFDSGFTGKPADKPAATEGKPAKTEAATAAPEGATVAAEETPEFIQVTKKDWDEIRAAAAKTASYDQQLSRVFGTLGNLQKLVQGFQAQTPKGGKVEIPATAFAQMEKDFPELAAQTRAALEAALAGVHGTGTAAAAIDDSKVETMMAAYTAKREIEALEDAYPEWRTIVGAVSAAGEQPDMTNPFRKWLASKDAAYQARVNASESAAVISRAIRLFQNETKAAKPTAAATPRNDARAERIRAAVQPRGDGAGVPAGKTADDDFLEGFNSR
jgi:hypothetical protein